MECLLTPTQTRKTFTIISFGAIFLWIWFGSYANQDQPLNRAVRTFENTIEAEGKRESWSHRSLLSISPELLGLSNDACNMVNMVKKKEKTDTVTQLVNISADEVRGRQLII